MDQHVAHPERQLGLTRLDELAKDVFVKGLAPSTTRTYDSAKCRYITFCQLYHLIPLPLLEAILYRFVTLLSTQSLKYQSIKSYLISSATSSDHTRLSRPIYCWHVSQTFPQLKHLAPLKLYSSGKWFLPHL